MELTGSNEHSCALPQPDLMVPYSARRLYLDVLCAALLLTVTVGLRVPALEVVAFNVDESQYEARAAYLLATDQSAFDLPHGPVFATLLFRQMAAWFGPYCMWHVRVLVLLIAWVMAVLVHDIVRRETNRGWGLLAGLVFLFVNPMFGGVQANREWFSALPALAGWWLYMRAWSMRSTARFIALLVTGLLEGAAVCFKDQALPLTLAIVMYELLDVVTTRQWRQALINLSIYALGGVVACGVYLAGFLAHGSLARHLEFIFGFKVAYAATGEAGLVGSLRNWWFHFWVQLDCAAILVISYLLVAAVGISALCRVFKRPGGSGLFLLRPAVVLMSCALFTCVVAVSLGGRFFDHYYLYLMAPAAIMTTWCLAQLFAADRTFWPLATICLLLLVMDRVFAKPIARDPAIDPYRWMIQSALGAVAFGLYYVLIGLIRPSATERDLEAAAAGTSSVARQRWLRFELLAAPAVLTAIVTLLLIQMAGIAEFSWKWNAYMYQQPRLYSEQLTNVARLANHLQQISAPGDRLFVWGWRPELYSLTRLEPATRYEICQYVIDQQEMFQGGSPEFGRRNRAVLLEDLNRRLPRYFCDASRNPPGGDVDPNYSLQNYPELLEFLSDHYELLQTIDDIDLYVQRDDSARATPAAQPLTTEAN